MKVMLTEEQYTLWLYRVKKPVENNVLKKKKKKDYALNELSLSFQEI